MAFIILALAFIFNASSIASLMVFQRIAQVEFYMADEDWPHKLIKRAYEEAGDIYNPILRLFSSFVSLFIIPSTFAFIGYFVYLIVQIEWGWLYVALWLFGVFLAFWPVLDRGDYWLTADAYSAVRRAMMNEKPALAVNNHVRLKTLQITLVNIVCLVILHMYAG